MTNNVTSIRRRSVMVIDDEVLVRDTLRRALEGAGIEVVEAADGNEGLKAYLAKPTDVVVTDILMPEKEGIETIIELKREHPNVKIVAISGGDRTGNTDFLEMAGLLGADRIMQKPFRPKELLATIEDLFAAG